MRTARAALRRAARTAAPSRARPRRQHRVSAHARAVAPARGPHRRRRSRAARGARPRRGSAADPRLAARSARADARHPALCLRLARDLSRRPRGAAHRRRSSTRMGSQLFAMFANQIRANYHGLRGEEELADELPPPGRAVRGAGRLGLAGRALEPLLRDPLLHADAGPRRPAARARAARAARRRRAVAAQSRRLALAGRRTLQGDMRARTRSATARSRQCEPRGFIGWGTAQAAQLRDLAALGKPEQARRIGLRGARALRRRGAAGDDADHAAHRQPRAGRGGARRRGRRGRAHRGLHRRSSASAADRPRAASCTKRAPGSRCAPATWRPRASSSRTWSAGSGRPRTRR